MTNRTYGDDSNMMLLAWVEDGDLWFTNTSLGEVWTTWSTKCPTDEGRNRAPSWVKAELRLRGKAQQCNVKIILLLIYIPYTTTKEC